MADGDARGLYQVPGHRKSGGAHRRNRPLGHLVWQDWRGTAGLAAPARSYRQELNKIKSNEDRIKAAQQKAAQLKKKEDLTKKTIAGIQQDLEKASRQLDASNRRYEAAHRGRNTILGKIAQLG